MPEIKSQKMFAGFYEKLNKAFKDKKDIFIPYSEIDLIYAIMQLAEENKLKMCVFVSAKERILLWRRISMEYGIFIQGRYYSLVNHDDIDQGYNDIIDNDIIIFDQFYSTQSHLRHKAIALLKETLKAKNNNINFYIFADKREKYFPDNLKGGDYGL